MKNFIRILLFTTNLYVGKLITTCELFSDNPKDCVEKTTGNLCNIMYFLT